jgi:hypothetical protein
MAGSLAELPPQAPNASSTAAPEIRLQFRFNIDLPFIVVKKIVRRFAAALRFASPRLRRAVRQR